MGCEKYGISSHWFSCTKNLLTAATRLVGGSLEKDSESVTFDTRDTPAQLDLVETGAAATVETMKSASIMKGLMLEDDGGGGGNNDVDDSLRAAVTRPSHIGSGSFHLQEDDSVEVETNAPSSSSSSTLQHQHPAPATFASDALEETYGSLFSSDDFSTADALLFSDDNEEDDDACDNNAIQVCVQCV
jgi:hypothetical protein